MKVILLQDVPKLGQKYEIKNVAGGYGRNFLLPKGLVEIANKATLNTLEARKSKVEKERLLSLEALSLVLKELSGKKITLLATANEEGHLFAGIHSDEISKAIKESLGLNVPEKNISFAAVIKTVGDYEIVVQGKDEKEKINFTLTVERK